MQLRRGLILSFVSLGLGFCIADVPTEYVLAGVGVALIIFAYVYAEVTRPRDRYDRD